LAFSAGEAGSYCCFGLPSGLPDEVEDGSKRSDVCAISGEEEQVSKGEGGWMSERPI
jgi:hypothetical protein